jgi:hypothetical protein
MGRQTQLLGIPKQVQMCPNVLLQNLRVKVLRPDRSECVLMVSDSYLCKRVLMGLEGT